MAWRSSWRSSWWSPFPPFYTWKGSGLGLWVFFRPISRGLRGALWDSSPSSLEKGTGVAWWPGYWPWRLGDHVPPDVGPPACGCPYYCCWQMQSWLDTPEQGCDLGHFQLLLGPHSSGLMFPPDSIHGSPDMFAGILFALSVQFLILSNRITIYSFHALWIPSFLEHSIPTILDYMPTVGWVCPLSNLSLVSLLIFGPHRYFILVKIHWLLVMRKEQYLETEIGEQNRPSLAALPPSCFRRMWIIMSKTTLFRLHMTLCLIYWLWKLLWVSVSPSVKMGWRRPVSQTCFEITGEDDVRCLEDRFLSSLPSPDSSLMVFWMSRWGCPV